LCPLQCLYQPHGIRLKHTFRPTRSPDPTAAQFMSTSPCQLNTAATRAQIDWVAAVHVQAESSFAAARRIATRLGAHFRNGRAMFGFWTPELTEQHIASERIFLELFTPLDPLDWRAAQQTVRFRRTRIPLTVDGEYAWAAVDGVQPGTRQQLGALYWLIYRDPHDEWRTIVDPLAHSVPFTPFAPAELYDMDGMYAQRADRSYFMRLDAAPDTDGVPRIGPPCNILQIHINTASTDGTLAGLTARYRAIADKVRRNEPLTPAEQNYVEYDAVQLMPIEPTIVFETGPPFWEMNAADGEDVHVTLRQPDMTNWGYDVLTVASPAPNPCVLGSKRPDELVDFIATLHNFPGRPIKVVLDVVYGHTDNQTLPLLHRHYFAGANMYGQNLNYTHPMVRAMLLEMQRRKSDYGVDGVRVDGAQDFKYWVAETDTLHHDDDYLARMNHVEQEVAGQRYRPWMIFEDGRPWPRADWELASSYREVSKQHANVVQWGPLTFAHNTPFLFTFWASKWWRSREIMQFGSHWITGCANHDTLRRGTQVDPEQRINTYLGDTLPDILKNAYDNPAANLFAYAFSPGIPMDFLNATMRAPWSFIRNTDDRYGVKIVAEEAYFLDWGVNEGWFAAPDAFVRLKDVGFVDLSRLKRFLRALNHAMQMTDYDLGAMATLLNTLQPPLLDTPFSAPRLKAIARAWMDDVHDYCNVARWLHQLDPARTQFNRDVRAFRRARPWLMQNLRPEEQFDYLHPTDGAVLFYGRRIAPDASEQVLFVANMEGASRSLTPTQLPISNLPQTGWRPALVSPGVQADRADQPLTLHNSQGIVFRLFQKTRYTEKPQATPEN